MEENTYVGIILIRGFYVNDIWASFDENLLLSVSHSIWNKEGFSEFKNMMYTLKK